MASLNLDLTGDKTQDFEPLPPGDYVVQVADSGVEESKSHDYMMAKFEFDVIAGEFKGRKLWEKICIQGLTAGANSDAIRIGREKLKTLASVSGHKNPNFIRDTEELHGLVVQARVKLDENGEYNRIKGYKKADAKGNGGNGGSVAPAPSPQAPKQAAPASTEQKLPWQK